MATVTSFEALERPSRSELRQFAELFQPLYAASSEEARRQAVAALSQCPNIPSAVAFFIASQPITIAAPFIAASKCLDDQTLITIARTQGAAHARAVVRRENLSPMVIDALVGLRHAPEASQMAAEKPKAAKQQPPLLDETVHPTRDEALRERLRAMAAHVVRPESDRLGLRTVTPMQEALLVRFARNRETDLFATALADTLSASRWLAERIMLDISGHQLATTLKGIGMPRNESLLILERLYHHLDELEGGVPQSERLWDALDTDECGRRVEAWGRADRYTYEDRRSANAEPTQAEPAELRTGTNRR
ncbi:uncharacterized protein (DUF2336 family) [Neorhizobium huautlense]|uniref:Uncharacterized protein (DUF2336 family) n=2 Tax=Neorhizobium huautlense TaxID=67774 RepID=A0ABT9Q0A9_9HYPH|nr:DUF2336 domain-containing protein [Neorhizobium huautlense]MDP9839539.1 uncharacterized protein (DUF2336 family) [Neorhizobium huautlense]